MKNKGLKNVQEIKKQIKKNKGVFAVYAVLRLFVIIALILSCVQAKWENVFTCALSLILFLLPAFIEKNFKIDLPSALEIIILLFIFAAEILGEIQAYYIKYVWWDTLLHTINGFLCAAVGFALVDIINQNSRLKFNLSPIYLAITAFCFSMTIGVAWEFFEFFADVLLGTDMQKDTIVNTLATVSMDLTKTNQVVLVPEISETILKLKDGSLLGLSSYGISGYLDIGLIDTMKDLFVNFIGAVIFSIIGYFYVKNRGRGKLAKNLIPKLTEDENPSTNN